MASTSPTAATVNLPLNRLHPSSDNVRREVGPRGGRTGRYFVVAGGRLLAALHSLAEAGEIGRTAHIPMRCGGC